MEVDFSHWQPYVSGSNTHTLVNAHVDDDMSHLYKTALTYTHNVGYLPLSFPGLAGVGEVKEEAGLEEVDCHGSDSVAKKTRISCNRGTVSGFNTHTLVNAHVNACFCLFLQRIYLACVDLCLG